MEGFAEGGTSSCGGAAERRVGYMHYSSNCGNLSLACAPLKPSRDRKLSLLNLRAIMPLLLTQSQDQCRKWRCDLDDKEIHSQSPLFHMHARHF